MKVVLAFCLFVLAVLCGCLIAFAGVTFWNAAAAVVIVAAAFVLAFDNGGDVFP